MLLLAGTPPASRGRRSSDSDERVRRRRDPPSSSSLGDPTGDVPYYQVFACAFRAHGVGPYGRTLGRRGSACSAADD